MKSSKLRRMIILKEMVPRINMTEKIARNQMRISKSLAKSS